MDTQGNEGLVGAMEFPSTELFSKEAGYENFDAAMGAYAQYAKDQDKAYLCAWISWQHFAKLLRPLYPGDAPEGKESILQVLSPMRLRHISTVFG